jgi:hypothetical protein
VEIGYGFEAEKNNPKCKVFLYAGFTGSNLNWQSNYEEGYYLSKFPDLSSAEKEFRKLLKASHAKARRLAKGGHRKVLMRFKIPSANAT